MEEKGLRAGSPGFWETPSVLIQGSGTQANTGATWSYAGAKQAKGALLAPLSGRGGWGARRLPLLSAREGPQCQDAHPTLGTLPTSVPQRAQPPDAHGTGPSPPSLACPLLLRPVGMGVW